MSTQIQITPETGITIGTTTVTSGTDTRVFFQEGGVVQQDANFTYNNTQKRLTLRAGGATASDIPFVVRNSANTENILACYGNELTIIGRNASTEPRLIINRAGSTKMVLGGTTDLNIEFPSSGFGELNSGAQGWDIISTSGDIRTRNSSTYTLLKGNFFGIGQATPAARLDVKAQGALSTDIAFRVRNSADTANILSVQGDGKVVHNLTASSHTPTRAFNVIGDNTEVIIEAGGWTTSGSNLRGFLARASNQGISTGLYIDSGGVLGSSAAGVLMFNGSNSKMNFVNGSNNCNGWAFLHTTAATYATANTVFAIYPTNAQAGGGTLALGTTLGTTLQTLPASTYGKNTFFIANGTAPTTTGADAFGMYSADITAGNAAPHFRTENGGIIKLYQETTGVAAATLVGGGGTTITDTDTFDGYTLKQIVKALRNQGILA